MVFLLITTKLILNLLFLEKLSKTVLKWFHDIVLAKLTYT
jgi:hypothetical protein